MDFKNILTLKLTGIIGLILIVFSFFLFKFSKSYFESSFENNLKNTSINIVNDLLELNKLDEQITNKKNKTFTSFSPNILVLNDSNETLVEYAKITNEIKFNLLNEISNKESYSISKGDTFYLAFKHQFKNRSYKIVSSSINLNGLLYFKIIKVSLLIFVIISVAFTYFTGIYFAKQTLLPIKNIIKQVEKFNEVNLNERLKTRNGKDEISLLATTFNQLLDRLENSFILQKSFVSNASHEFRTPLTVMKGQIEVLLLQPRSNEIYLNTYISLLEDINNQINLINGLGELANANAMFPNIVNSKISIIDLLDDCVSELYKNKNYKVVLTIEELHDDESTMYLNGNYALLKSAFINVMDNACKFSNTLSCQVNLICNLDFMSITVVDQGLGINKIDLANIFESFYRSNNTRHIQGHGIGLSLVKKIVEYYQGKITVTSEIGKGTKMSIYLPNVKAQNEGHI
ncbi:MAG: HAMP domain-containing sensor histidine kinase [Bacteroidia bacterium]